MKTSARQYDDYDEEEDDSSQSSSKSGSDAGLVLGNGRLVRETVDLFAEEEVHDVGQSYVKNSLDWGL